MLFGLWLAGRIAFWFAPALPSVLVAAADLVFLPALAFALFAVVYAPILTRPHRDGRPG
ncbi:MAG: hypothetical protein V3V17_06565 [Alphaproteobacteria bacterium]